MFECKKCGKETHHCSSCGFVSNAVDEGFCSDDCWETSKEYKENKEMFFRFVESLDIQQRTLFEIILRFGESYDYKTEEWLNV